jgi:pyruvate formate lyase activating enzyme
MEEGRIHSIESLGSLDGPGIRTVFFMQGCNMKCLYCHNRDSWDSKAGTNITVDEILKSVRSFREYYGNKGGVTFSGGEPLLQSGFLIEAVSRLKQIGIHCTIDTSGSVFSENTRLLMDLADLVILDIKHSDFEEYKILCNYSGQSAFRTLEYLQRGSTSYWIRQVILERYTGSTGQIDNLKKITQKGLVPEKIELLPYHEMGREKWTEFNEAYSPKVMKKPSEELMNQLNIRL